MTQNRGPIMCFLSGGKLLLIYIIVGVVLHVIVARSRSDGRFAMGFEAWNLSGYTRTGRRWFGIFLVWACIVGPVFVILWLTAHRRCNG